MRCAGEFLQLVLGGLHLWTFLCHPLGWQLRLHCHLLSASSWTFGWPNCLLLIPPKTLPLTLVSNHPTSACHANCGIASFHIDCPPPPFSCDTRLEIAMFGNGLCFLNSTKGSKCHQNVHVMLCFEVQCTCGCGFSAPSHARF